MMCNKVISNIQFSTLQKYLFFFIFMFVSAFLVYFTASNCIYFDFDFITWERIYQGQVFKNRQFPLMYYPEINEEMTYLTTMYHFFKTDTLPYHIAGMIFHFLAVIGIYLMTYSASRNMLAGIFAGLLFASLGSAIQVHSEPIYTLQFFPIFFIGFLVFLYLQSREKRDHIYFIFSLVLYFFIIYSSSRRYPIIIVIIILDLVWFVKSISSKNLWRLLYRIFGVLFTTYLVFHSGTYHGTYDENTGVRIQQVINGEWDILLYPLMDFGHIVDFKILTLFDNLIFTMFCNFIIFSALVFYLKLLSNAKKSHLFLSIGIGAMYMFFSMYIFYNYSSLFPYLSESELESIKKNVTYFFNGGLLIIVLITFAFYFRKTLYCDAVLFSLGWMIASTLLIKSFYFRGVIPSCSKYSLGTYVGVCIFLGVFFSTIVERIPYKVIFNRKVHFVKDVILNKNVISLSFIIFFVFLLVNNVSYNTNWFKKPKGLDLDIVKTDQKVHRQMMNIIISHQIKDYSLFLIESEVPDNRYQNMIIEASYYKFPVFFNRCLYDTSLLVKNPWAFADYQKLVGQIKTYYHTKTYPYHDFVPDLNNIYSFKILNSPFRLDNTSVQTRKRLLADLPEIFNIREEGGGS